MRKGLTLIELMITVVMMVILIGVTAYIFRAILLSWSGAEARAGIDIGLDRGIEEMARDLREAKAITSVNNDEIRFTTTSDTYHIYYLYNTSDTYAPDFLQSSYELRKADLSGSITGALVDAGRVIITDILPPTPGDVQPSSDLSYSGNIVTIDLSVKRKDETIRSETQVRPRNWCGYGGYSSGGYCWRYGSLGATCTTTCAAYGGCAAGQWNDTNCDYCLHIWPGYSCTSEASSAAPVMHSSGPCVYRAAGTNIECNSTPLSGDYRLCACVN